MGGISGLVPPASSSSCGNRDWSRDCVRQPLGFHQGMEAWTRTPKSPLHTHPQEYLLKEKKRCFLPLKLSCASWSNPLSFPKNQSAPLRPTGKHFQVLVVGRTKPDQAVAAQGALPELSLGFAAREGGVGSPRCHGDDPLGKEGRSTGMILWGRRADPRHPAPTPVGCTALVLIPAIGSTHCRS